MADVREMRIFSADQIVVPQELPQILKEFSKEVIRQNPDDLVKFGREYFESKLNQMKNEGKKWVSELHFKVLNLTLNNQFRS